MASSTIARLAWLPLLSRCAQAGVGQSINHQIKITDDEDALRNLRKDNVTAKANNTSSNDIVTPKEFLNDDEWVDKLPAPSTQPPLKPASVIQTDNCGEDELLWFFELVTDDYAYETSWELKDNEGAILASGPPVGIKYQKRTRYVGRKCLGAGQYMLTIKDMMGDGNCCEFGEGSFSVSIDGVLLVESDGSAFSVKDLPFLIQSVSTDTDSPTTRRPSQKPSPAPTTAPSTSAPTSSFLPTLAPTTSSEPTVNPSPHPTAEPSISWSRAPSESPSIASSDVPSETPSQAPSTASSEAPSSFSSESPSASKSAAPSTIPPMFDFSGIFPPTEEPTSSPTVSPTTTRTVVPISPFNLYMTIGAGSDDTDIDELDTILSDHLFQQLQANLPESGATKLDLSLNKISSIGRRLQDESDGPTQSENFDVTIKGDAYFAGDVIPTTEQIDEINQASFEGVNGNQFIVALRSAEDPALQSVQSISIPLSLSDDADVEESYLRNGSDAPEEGTSNALYVIIVVVSVGVLLVAVFVQRSRLEKRLQQGGFPNDGHGGGHECDNVSLPTYIEVVPDGKDRFGSSYKKCHVVGERREGESVGYGGYSETMTEVESQILPTDASRSTKGPKNPSHFSDLLMQPAKEDEAVEAGFFCGMNGNAASAPVERKRVVQNDWGLNPSGSNED